METKLDHTIVKRLAFIKYLYQTSVIQSRAPSPLKCASILTMHDAVELFLHLASEYLDAGSNQPNFMDYWDSLKKKLEPKELGQKGSMRRLNKARVSLKHHGTFPSDFDIESFRASVTAFFKDNTQLVFDSNIDDISLIDFVNPETARVRLKNAQDHIKSGDIHAALDEIAIGFNEMIADYENRKRNYFHSSPFYFAKNMAFQSSFFIGLRHGSSTSIENKLGSFVDNVKESIEAMQNAIKILALGIDYRRYSRFKMLTPHILLTTNGEWIIQRTHKDSEEYSEDDARFCLDFTIESAFALIEYDYTVSRSK